jgi:hypothetical protein
MINGTTPPERTGILHEVSGLQKGQRGKSGGEICSVGLFVYSVQDFVGNAQAFDGLVIHDVRFDDFVDVFGPDSAVKNALRVDGDGGAELALIEAAGLIGANELDAALREFHFKEPL